MERIRVSTRARSAVCLAGLLCGMLAVQPALAESKNVITVRRAVGVAFLGGSAVLAKKGLDFKDEADEFHVLYKKAPSDEEAERLHQLTTNRDVKSQVCWALAASCVISGLRLVFTRGMEAEYGHSSLSAPRTADVAPGLRLESQLGPGRVGLCMRKRFF
jgi:hypothetical protein